jgi:hypothetical protein
MTKWHAEREGDERQHDDRNARLGEHGGAIRDRQRLPEQDAAVAALAVERIERVEQSDEKLAGMIGAGR